MRVFVAGLICFLGVVGIGFGQAAILPVTNTEYDIGLECPAAQTLSADGTTLWVLIEGCFLMDYTIQAFNTADGTLIDTGLSAESIAQLAMLQAYYIDWRGTPLALTPDETALSIIYWDSETYLPHTLLIPLSNQPVEPLITETDLADLLLSVTEYPEASIFSQDHTFVATLGTESLVVFDLTSQTQIFSLPIEVESYNAYPTFSKDNSRLYVAQFNDIEDMENYASTLSVYSLPDGELLSSFSVPSSFLFISPDERYAVIDHGANDGSTRDLTLVELATGATSEAISLYEPSRPLAACANDGRDMSDVDFTVTGRLQLAGLNWLPDNSGFVYTRSYNGEAAGGGRPCAFNTSRLNRIDLSE